MSVLNIWKRVIVAFAFVVALGVSAWATDKAETTAHFSGDQSQEIRDIVKNYLLAHPEILTESMQVLQDREQKAEDKRLSDAAKGMKPVNSEDHIRGNLDAPIKIVEFSDFECPFCKSFQPTLNQVMKDYGKEGKVAWIYRHFPLDNLHSKARKEAQATECAAELGGNAAFWAYADRLFEIAPSNNELDLALLPKVAQDVGLDQTKFEACLAGDQNGGKFAAHIEANLKDGMAAGGTGTPYTLIVGTKGQIFPISGGMPYEAIKSIIDAAFKAE